MKFAVGQAPDWKSRPKPSPLDDDADFQKLVTRVTGGTMKPDDEAGLFIDTIEDGQRLGVKHPARTARDTLNRILADHNLTQDFDVTCRQTADEGVWALWVTRLDTQ